MFFLKLLIQVNLVCCFGLETEDLLSGFNKGFVRVVICLAGYSVGHGLSDVKKILFESKPLL